MFVKLKIPLIGTCEGVGGEDGDEVRPFDQASVVNKGGRLSLLSSGKSSRPSGKHRGSKLLHGERERERGRVLVDSKTGRMPL